jgi:hypothetical protein
VVLVGGLAAVNRAARRSQPSAGKCPPTRGSEAAPATAERLALHDNPR